MGLIIRGADNLASDINGPMIVTSGRDKGGQTDPGPRTIDITRNGWFDVKEYDQVHVNVPVPPGYVLPSGKKTITANGDNIDVANYKYAKVDVPSAQVAGVIKFTNNSAVSISVRNSLTITDGKVSNEIISVPAGESRDLKAELNSTGAPMRVFVIQAYSTPSGFSISASGNNATVLLLKGERSTSGIYSGYIYCLGSTSPYYTSEIVVS